MRTAEEWIARLQAADVTAEERRAFETWLAEAGHRDEYAQCLRLAAMPGALRDHPDLMVGLQGRLARLRSAAQGRPRARWGGIPLALAATVALVTLGALLYLNVPSGGGVSGLSAETRHGEQRPISLGDGSTVKLNTDSLIEWSLSGKERRVVLKRGEAFFDVAKDPARPFVVRAGKSEVRVVGTQFSVRRQGDELEVVVKEGRVSIVPDTGPLAILSAKVELTPGNRVRVDAASREIRVTAVDAERITAWSVGSLEFDGMTLDQVVAEVNRYTDISLVIVDEGIKAQRMSGRVRVGDLDTIRFILRERFDIESADRNGTIQLYRR